MRIAASTTSVTDPVIVCICGKCAVAFLEIHAVDECGEEPTRGQFFCSECLEKHVEIAQFVADCGTEFCEVCGKSLTRIFDIIVRVCHIN